MLKTAIRFSLFGLLLSCVVAAGCRPEANEEPEVFAYKTSLQDSDPEVRARALMSITSLQFLPAEDVPYVIRLLGDDLRIIRMLAADCLLLVGPEGKSQLEDIKAAHDKETDVEIRGKLRDAMTRIRQIP